MQVQASRVPTPHSVPRSSCSNPAPWTGTPIGGVDVHVHPGALLDAVADRAEDGTVLFLSVGDQRDHRRQHKDPQLRVASVTFLANMIGRLHALGKRNYLVLTSRQLCERTMHARMCDRSCVWSSLWENHPNLPAWKLEAGDMILLWMQQWRYIVEIARAGTHVLRADTDVYFHEDPVPLLLHAPLFAPYGMVVQHDFFGPGDRPPRPLSSTSRAVPRGSGRDSMNVGLLFLRGGRSNAATDVLAESVADFETLLASNRSGRRDVGELIDQRLIRAAFMRAFSRDWTAAATDAASIYGPRNPCSHQGRCEQVVTARSRSAFLWNAVRSARVALAPDWMFGRGCVTRTRVGASFLERRMRQLDGVNDGGRLRIDATGRATKRKNARRVSNESVRSMWSFVVATHFVYSKAQKRLDAFDALGWSKGGGVWRPSDRCRPAASQALVVGHTLFGLGGFDLKTTVCVSSQEDDRKCCRAMPAVFQRSRVSRLRHVEGCSDYQELWD